MYPLRLLRDSLPDSLSTFYQQNTRALARFKLNATKLKKQSEVDFLILFIENQTKCEVINHWLDNNKETLNVVFESNRALKQLPISHHLICNTMSLINDEKYFSRNEKILILTNIRHEDEQYLTIYIKNLVIFFLLNFYLIRIC